MSVAPLPAIVHHPWFIADIPGWHNDAVGGDETFINDRIYLETSIKMIENSQNLPLAFSLAGLLDGSRERLFFQSAFHYKDIYKQFAKRHCPRTESNMAAARSQLDEALRLYPELDNKGSVLEIKKLLAGDDGL